MKAHVITFVGLALVFLFCPPGETAETGVVARVIDGDTFETIRLIGVDCPELTRSGSGWLAGVADSARSYLREILTGKEVTLEFGQEVTDRYSRALCYVSAAQGGDSILVNQELIRMGLGSAFLRYPHDREDRFIETEIEARRASRGMWGRSLSMRDIIDPVFLTPTGHKFHSSDCSKLEDSNGGFPVGRDCASECGFEPCKICDP